MRAHFGSGHPSTLIVLDSLGRIYREEGRFEEAETLLAAALEACRRARPGGGPDLWQALHSMALLHRDAGRHADAEPLARELVSLLPASRARRRDSEALLAEIQAALSGD